MGLQVNLNKMLGLEPKIKCPNCGHFFKTKGDDYDLECGNPNPKPGIWALDYWCDECDFEWTVEYKITANKIA
jgi:transposase-like protein